MTNTEKATKVRELIQRETDKVLSEYTVSKVQEEINKLMEGRIRNTILERLGLDQGWHSFRVNKGSPLYNKIEDAVNLSLEDVRKLITPVILTPKEISIIQKEYKSGYYNNMKKLAEMAGQRDADNEFAVLKDVFTKDADDE